MAKFRIGLAMAGAVSAGAYTAGVLDFLIEALDAWEDAKDKAKSDGEPVPMHEVSLVVSSGASAGSMCSALLAVALPYAFPHIRLDAQRRPQGDTGKNPLYSSWVDRIDIRRLLELGDITPKRIPSYLNSGVVDEILRDCLNFTAPLKPRPWVAQPFLTRLSVGNLRGVPYAVPTKGSHDEADSMVEHADHMSFAITPQPQQASEDRRLADHFVMTPHPTAIDNVSRKPWDLLGQAALASGAFPLALRPRALERPADHYVHRHAVERWLPTGDECKPQRLEIMPSWSLRDPPNPYRFVCMDGGIFNNEPFQLAHSALLREDNRAHNPPDADHADAAVVMIDPFTAAASTPTEFCIDPIEKLIPKLINAWTKQARFNAKDLGLAHDPGTYSRYLIAPSRSGIPPKSEAHPLASGGLGGFFGFFHEEFRKHDYQLGRRNCQQFLREHFTIPDTNRILKGGYDGLTIEQCKPYTTENGRELQIIPLMPHLRVNEPEPIWPTGLLNLNDLIPKIEARLDAVYAHYRDKLLAGIESWPKRKIAQGYLWSAWKFGLRKEAIKRLLALLNKAQQDQGL